MEKIKALRNMIVEGIPVEAGAEVECSDGVARYLVNIGKAELIESKSTAKKRAARKTAEAGPGEDADAPEAKKSGK